MSHQSHLNPLPMTWSLFPWWQSLASSVTCTQGRGQGIEAPFCRLPTGSRSIAAVTTQRDPPTLYFYVIPPNEFFFKASFFGGTLK